MSEVHVNTSDPITSSYQISVLMQTGPLTAEIQEFTQKKRKKSLTKAERAIAFDPTYW